MAIDVAKVEIKSVADASGLEELIVAGRMAADSVVAVIGKTEGNGGVNDFTRILSDNAFRGVLLKHGTRERGGGRRDPHGLVGRLRRRAHAACDRVRQQ